MKYKTNKELEGIINSSEDQVSANVKKQATNELDSRKDKSIEQLNYELNLKQTQKLSSINGILIFFLVLSIFSIIGSILMVFMK